METAAFLRMLAHAESLSGAEAWGDAARCWEQVVAVNPVEGRFWTRLAEARYCARDYHGAVAASEEALALGDGYPAEAAYRIACCQAQLGESEPALDSFERALALGFRHLDRAAGDDAFSSLRDNARFRDLVGLIEQPAFSATKVGATTCASWRARSSAAPMTRFVMRRSINSTRPLLNSIELFPT